MQRALAALTLSCLLLALPSSAGARKKKKATTTEEVAPAPPVEEAPVEPVAPSEPPPDEAPPRPKPERRAPEPAPVSTETVPGSFMDPVEKPGVHMLFLGLRYRGTIVPRFLVGLFVDEGRTVYSNSFGLEIDLRHDGYSVIPNLTYTEYGMSDTLFLQKGKPVGDAAWYSMIHSNLKAIFLGVDVLWSSSVHRNIDIEYGLGVGVGFVFGDLINNWVYGDGAGPLASSDGMYHFSACASENGMRGCGRGDHSNPDTAKVNGYVEPNWFSGGAVPVFFPRIAPQFGLRVKVARDIETRIVFGFSLTEGFFFGLSANYRLSPRPPSSETTAEPAEAPSEEAAPATPRKRRVSDETPPPSE